MTVLRLLLVAACLAGFTSSPQRVSAQPPTPAIEPDIERELEELLALTLPQQKERARRLIEEYPGTELARILQRLLNEYEVFDQLAADEQRLREAQSAWVQAYWRDRCCPLPPWNPPLGRIINETGEPILYEQRIDGIHRTRWSGPFRLGVGRHYESPYPFLVRYLAAGGVHVRMIAPGESYAFRGTPSEGEIVLLPATSPAPLIVPAPEAPAPPAPPPPVREPADEEYDPTTLRTPQAAGPRLLR
jgi:hypothetical protein